MNGAKGKALFGGSGTLLGAALIFLLQQSGLVNVGDHGVQIAAQAQVDKEHEQRLNRHDRALQKSMDALAEQQKQITTCQQAIVRLGEDMADLKRVAIESDVRDRKVEQKLWAVLGWIDEQRTQRVRGYEVPIDTGSPESE